MRQFGLTGGHHAAVLNGLPDVRVSHAASEEGLETLEVSALNEGAAFVAAGQWLERRAAEGSRRTIEDFDWAPPGAYSVGYTLLLTLSPADQVG